MSVEPAVPAPSPVPLLSVDDVSFRYGDHLVLDSVSLEISSREFVALTGDNGSGKTTLIKTILGLLRPSSGTVRVFSTDLHSLKDRSRLGYVPQRPRVDADLPATVTEIVATGRLSDGGWWRRRGARDREAIAHAIAIAGLEEQATAPIATLSGGQQQRTFIARALASTPELLILDEPTTGVDAESQRRFRDALVHHVRVHGGAVLLVTHDVQPVAADLDRILQMKDGKLC